MDANDAGLRLASVAGSRSLFRFFPVPPMLGNESVSGSSTAAPPVSASSKLLQATARSGLPDAPGAGGFGPSVSSSESKSSALYRKADILILDEPPGAVPMPRGNRRFVWHHANPAGAW